MQEDVADAWGSALSRDWDSIDAEPCYGVRIVLGSIDNDERLIAVISPRVFSTHEGASQALDQLSTGLEGEEFIRYLATIHWLVLPVGKWTPLAFRVVRLAEIPF